MSLSADTPDSDVVAEHYADRRARQMARLAASCHHSRISGTRLDAVLEGDDVIDIQEPSPVEVEAFVAESPRARDRHLEIEAATGTTSWSGDNGRLRYLGRMERGRPASRDLDDQDLAFAIDELQRARCELAVAYDLDAPRIQKRHAIDCATDRARLGMGFVLDLLDRHEVAR